MRAALALFGLGFLATLVVPAPIGAPAESDLPVYAYYAEFMLEGELPYRDFGFEYPPLAAPLLALGGLGDYEVVFGLLAFLMACAVVALAGELASRTGGDRRTALFGAVAALVLCGALIRTRFDLAPVALTLAALVLLCAARPGPAFAVLGLGVLTKGFPLVVVPVALAWLAARGEVRAAIRSAAVLAGVVGVVVGAALALSPDGFADSLRYHLDRPAQVESSPAVVLTALDALGAGTADTEQSFGSAGVRHPELNLVLGLFTALLAAVVALLAGAVTVHRPPSERDLVLASLAAVAAFAVLGKVLSPQFMIWIAPLTALAAAWRMWPLLTALVAAHVLTLVEYPRLYDAVVRGEDAATVVVGLRNAALLVAVAVAAAALLAGGAQRDRRSREHRTDPPNPVRGSARSRWPGRLRRPRPAPR